MRPLIAGNWKMNGLGADLAELKSLKGLLAAAPPTAEVMVCPPATLIARAAWTVGGAFVIGAQDCAVPPRGAFTGDVSAEMLKDGGAGAVILGHSERRRYHNETDAEVAAKAAAAWRAGLRAIICIGETADQRKAGEAYRVCETQIGGSVPIAATAANAAIAYEPVWAIGTGVTPSLDDIARMHAHIRATLVGRLGSEGARLPILYGGSVNGANAKEILALPEVGGALVGGASLKAADFAQIIASAPSKP